MQPAIMWSPRSIRSSDRPGFEGLSSVISCIEAHTADPGNKDAADRKALRN